MAVRRLGALALVAGLLAGCMMSLQDLRQQPPARTATFADRQYDVLAGCVAEGLQMGQQTVLYNTAYLVYTVTIRPDQRRATITGYRSDTMSPNLDVILGLATCSCCGGGMIVRSRDFHNHRRYAYTCGYFHARGRSVCQNSLDEAPMSDANHTVLETIRQDLLRRDVLEATMRKAVALLSPSPADADRRREALRRRLAEMTQELERSAVAIARGGEIPELLSAIAERQQQRQVIQDELARLDTFQRVNWADVKRAQQDVRVRLAGWRGLLHRQPDEARGLLRELLVGRLAFTPPD